MENPVTETTNESLTLEPNQPVTPVTTTSMSKMSSPTSSPLNTTPIENEVEKKKKKMMLLVIALIIFIVAIAIAAFLLLSKNQTPIVNNTITPTPTPVVNPPVVSTPVTSNTGLTPEEQMNQGNPQSTMNTFNSRIFNWTFEYPKSLGLASSTTSNFSYTAGVECYTENITFSNNPDIIVGASSGHCEGGSGNGGADTFGVTAKDNKSYFVTTVQNPDSTYRISVKGGVDSSSNYPAGVEGVYMEAAKQVNADIGTTILGQIIKNSVVDLTTLKTQDFDKVSTH